MTRGNLEHSAAHAALLPGLQDRDHSQDRDAAQKQKQKDRARTDLSERLLTEKELSDWLGVSLPNLQRMRSTGTGPRFVQLSARRIAYRKSDVEAWLTARTTDRIGALAPIRGTPVSVAEVGA
jgi:predicted DNA-binding transcriptional regulator AlpA